MRWYALLGALSAVLALAAALLLPGSDTSGPGSSETVQAGLAPCSTGC
ncbi:hypothetical protein [Lentzea flava]|nr:hypothetical protein [Lentzea flava]MCP2201004.1 hypothetical protein [Lentzea flava]